MVEAALDPLVDVAKRLLVVREPLSPRVDHLPLAATPTRRAGA
jgi:hypothetical protein